jgi:hypothetical protein
MLAKIKEWFSGNSFKADEPIKFKEFGREEVSSQYPNALLDLTDSKLDGFLIKSFLTKEEVAKVLKNLEKVNEDKKAFTSVGYTYPMIFAEYSGRIASLPEEVQVDKNHAYFLENLAFKNDFSNEFEVDIPGRLSSFFSSISGDLEVGVPSGGYGDGVYPFGNFRYLQPGSGFMAIHCGNFFQTRFKEVYQNLSKQVAVRNQLSYFIMLNKPDAGGKLTIFNLRWEDGQTKVDNMEDKDVILPSGKVIQPDSQKGIEPFDIDPQPGDMVLFQGGNIWHRISNVEGSQPRITFGGFMGKGLDGKRFLYWS